MENNISKTYHDYIDKIQEEFPYLTKREIKIITGYGWRQMYILNVGGGDVMITSRNYNYWFYSGELTKDSLKHFSYYKKKMITKLRVMYKRKNIQWDGYYYIAITDTEYEEFMAIKNQKGRKRKIFYFENKCMFKILDECKTVFTGIKYFLRFKSQFDFGYFYKKQKLRCEYPEIAFTRDSAAKFKDILVSNDNYEYL